MLSYSCSANVDKIDVPSLMTTGLSDQNAICDIYIIDTIWEIGSTSQIVRRLDECASG